MNRTDEQILNDRFLLYPKCIKKIYFMEIPDKNYQDAFIYPCSIKETVQFFSRQVNQLYKKINMPREVELLSKKYHIVILYGKIHLKINCKNI